MPKRQQTIIWTNDGLDYWYLFASPGLDGLMSRCEQQCSMSLWLCTRFAIYQDGVNLWKYFPRYWPFMRGTTSHLWIPLTKTNNAELWCFVWSEPDQTVYETIKMIKIIVVFHFETPVIWDAVALIMTLLWWLCIGWVGVDIITIFRVTSLPLGRFLWLPKFQLQNPEDFEESKTKMQGTIMCI